jgi:hypothetical protein
LKITRTSLAVFALLTLSANIASARYTSSGQVFKRGRSSKPVSSNIKFSSYVRVNSTLTTNVSLTFKHGKLTDGAVNTVKPINYEYVAFEGYRPTAQAGSHSQLVGRPKTILGRQIARFQVDRGHNYKTRLISVNRERNAVRLYRGRGPLAWVAASLGILGKQIPLD